MKGMKCLRRLQDAFPDGVNFHHEGMKAMKDFAWYGREVNHEGMKGMKCLRRLQDAFPDGVNFHHEGMKAMKDFAW